MEFTPEIRKLIVNVKLFFDQNKKNAAIQNQSSTDLTASALGISKSTVKVIMSAFNKSGEDGLSWSKQDNRGRPTHSIETGTEAVVRAFVRDANANGRQVTVDIMAKYLADLCQCNVATSTLWRALIRWGFEFGTGTRSAQLKESERIIIQRRRYLREKIANRKSDGTTIRPEIYLDESYINKNHSKDDTWYFGEDGASISKPTGKGDRLIIVNAISRQGWIPNAKLVFKSSKKTGDYHASMNWSVFSTWFKDQLLPNIPENSIIIMDNAPYHNVLAEETFPKHIHSVRALQEWLNHNNHPWTDDMLKSELFDLCQRLSPKPEFAIDKFASEKGHTILRTPPYHPELQPIETCWAVVKGHVAANNNFTMTKVKELLEEGFDKVTSHTIDGITTKVKKQEDTYWREDFSYFDLEERSEENAAD